jgi:hypothetical protein
VLVCWRCEQADIDECDVLRDKLKHQINTADQHRRESKLLEGRAVHLAAEVERYKQELLVRALAACSPC